MPTLLIGIAILLLVLWAARQFAGANPHVVVQSLKKGGGFAALAGAAFLAATGRFSMAVPLGFLAMGLLDWLPGRNAFGSWAKPAPGQTSRVRSAMIEMELDHDSGTISGTFTAGPHAGTPLDALTPEALVAMLASMDEESCALLEVYLDRRAPGWRENVEEDAGTRRTETASHRPMSEEEACQILGIKPGASASEIRRAHRALMLKLHPDHGGSTYLAARVNEAKEILLRTHH